MYESVDHIIGIVAVTYQVLAAQQHLERSVWHQFLKYAHSVPGIFVQKTGGDVEGSSAPDLHGIETGLVHFGSNRYQVFYSNPGCQSGLMSVPEGNIGEFNRI